MSPRTHFWLRIVGLAAILATEFGPRLWNTASSSGGSAQGARIAAVAEVSVRP